MDSHFPWFGHGDDLGSVGLGKLLVMGSKETLTLALFVELSVAEVAYFEKKPKIAKWLGLVACVLTIITLLSSFIIAGLHSFLLLLLF